MEDIEDIFEGSLEKPVEDVQGKNWLKKSFTKKWKKVYCVLRKYGSSEQAFLQIFEKEDRWRQQMPKGTLELFPRYRVLKKSDVKGKPHVFEISNDAEVYILAADSETVLDLWVIQLQMQTRLNPRVAGKTFRVQCSGSQAMQRIGGKDQFCLLHISRWGVTLALERTRAVLAQWPLTTIRNYESMDRGEFSFEAGRKAPMGEGKYTFGTQFGEDNSIFDTIDGYTSARLSAQNAGGAVLRGSDEELSMAYDQLRFSVLNIPQDTPFERGGSVRSMDMSASAPRAITNEPPSSYDRIDRSDSIGSARSLGSFSPSQDPFSSRHSSFGSQTDGSTARPTNYDTLDHARSMVSMSFKESSRNLSRSAGSYNHIPTSSLRGTPDYWRRDPPTCPLEVSPEADERTLSNRTGSPSSPDFSSSGDYSKLDGYPVDAASSSTLTEERLPPPLPARGKTLPAYGSKSNTIKAFKEKLFSKKSTDSTKAVNKTSMSPNFVYLNSCYSKSIEVLPSIYATVDKEKKKRDRERKAKKKAKAFENKRKMSKSCDSLSGSPRLNSFSFTPFSFKGLASALDSESDSDLSDSRSTSGSDQGFNFSGEIVPPKSPLSDRVSMAHRGTIDRDEPSRAFLTSSALNSREVAALHSTLSQSPQLPPKVLAKSSDA
ncbi:uncharacterized protein LOC5515259 [Nematostella vectensis]|uniref:uncharacterized protein LOC5515259 n=1 Tax=Nematostella vectensis TaxID=45351 RepID=UPI002077360B|nr:uncharacterized protein LOC5515259 [Nematostella vectensis]